MKKLLLILAVLVVGGLGALATTFTAATLPAGESAQYEPPVASPPPEMKLYALEAGKMFNQAGFAYRGGRLSEKRVFGMGGILVDHPQGKLLFDSGFGRDVDEHFKTIPALMRATSKYEKEPTVAEQLAAAGIEPAGLKGVVLTHAHWDHVSGLPDLKGAKVWVTQAELDFVNSGNQATTLARSLEAVDFQPYDFPGGRYLGYPRSFDVFADGSVVLVPGPGHTPGSIIAFVNLPAGQRYALVGDLVWQTEGVDLPAERPWLSRRLVDFDDQQVRGQIVHMHQIKAALPELVIVPAHDRRVWDALPKLPAGQASVR